jgi:hypothetical protein
MNHNIELSSEIEGIYLDKYPVSGKVISMWKTLNMNNAYRVELTKPEIFFDNLHKEVILFDEDIISIKSL